MKECHIISYNCVGSCDGSAVSLGKDELIPVKFINIKYNTYFKLPLRRESTLLIIFLICTHLNAEVV